MQDRTLHRVTLPLAVFGVFADHQGRIEPNPEIGWTLTYSTIEALTAAVERQGGSVVALAEKKEKA